MNAVLLIRNIGQLLRPKPLEHAAVVCAGETILWAGADKELPPRYADGETIDAGGALVSPGLIDCHTHLVFAGSRSAEFFARLNGDTYELISQKGGGIAGTVRSTRKAGEEELLHSAGRRLDAFLKFGVTTVEAKSGYGLSVEDELRILRITGKIRHAVDVIPTFLGAHVVPAEFKDNRSAYVRLVCEEMLPKVKAGKLSGICDVFCDEGAFSAPETRRIFSAARDLGFRLKLHADQFKGTGGAELAAEFRALSADHVERVSEAGIRALARSGTVAVLLPGALFFLGKRTYPPARDLIEAGVPVAVSTDFNPGTSHTQNLPLMMTFAAVEMKMTVGEIWSAVTVNAAKALGLTDRGRIEAGQLADLAIWDAQDAGDIPYQFGAARVSQVIKRGKKI